MKAKHITMLTEEACSHTEMTPDGERKKWNSIPYLLPDGTRGVWWQPYRNIRYKDLDFTYSRARWRLSRIHKKKI